MSDLGVICDGSLLIRDGRLEEVGTSRRVENLDKARDAVEINAAGRVVMPGFVDSHTHLICPAAGTETLRTAPPIRSVSGSTLEARARQCLEGMARHGTTTIEIKTGCTLDESVEAKLLRVIEALRDDPIEAVATFLMRIPAEMDPAAYEWLTAELLPKIRRRRWARFVDLVWEADSGQREFASRYLQAARKLGFGCKIHAGPADCAGALAAAAGELAVTVDHVEHASPDEIRVLAGSGTMATLLPSEGFRRGRFGPARDLIEAGIPVALGSNFNQHLNPTLNMQGVVTLACMFLGMSPEEAISAATINGAHALGCASNAGSLEVGKAADLLILNISDYREMSQNLGGNLVHMTMKRGDFIYQEGAVAPRPIAELQPQWRM